MGKEEPVDRRRCWKTNIKVGTGMAFASSTRTAGDKARSKGVVAKSPMVPQRPGKFRG